MNEKIDKLATQHKVIGAKTDCRYFSNVGRLCSRVENGMMRCDEYLECEFKYIDALKEENEKLKEALASFMNGEYCAEGCKKMNNAFCDVHKSILKENEKQKDILKEIKQIATNQDLYRGRQALATKILQMIENIDQKESEE